jgi:hypothetical protein
MLFSLTGERIVPPLEIDHSQVLPEVYGVLYRYTSFKQGVVSPVISGVGCANKFGENKQAANTHIKKVSL